MQGSHALNYLLPLCVYRVKLPSLHTSSVPLCIVCRNVFCFPSSWSIVTSPSEEDSEWFSSEISAHRRIGFINPCTSCNSISLLSSKKKSRKFRKIEKEGWGSGSRGKNEKAFFSQPPKIAKWTNSAKPDMGNLSGSVILSHKGSGFRIEHSFAMKALQIFRH